MVRLPSTLRALGCAAAAALALAGCGKSSSGDAGPTPTPTPPPPTCSDSARNGAETDVDCGGGTCPACADGKACGAARDCASGVCSATCQAPTCGDGVRNGAETDADCGGGTCPPCGAGKACSVGADCASFACATTCIEAPSCTDGVRNGLETDVDCGGPICPFCVAGQSCSRARDCDTLLCSSGLCQALGPTCGNGIKDGAETDIDCGGGQCAACRAGLACAAGSDCRSGVCTAGGVCCSSTVTLAWDAPATNTDGSCVNDLAGFRVYFGTATGTYGPPVDRPLGSPDLQCAANGAVGPCGAAMSCTTTVTIPAAGTWFFATTAYDRGGLESAFSGEVSTSVTPCP